MRSRAGCLPRSCCLPTAFAPPQANRPAGLGVEAEHHGAVFFGVEPLLHDLGPQPAGRPVLGHLLQQIVMGIEEKGETPGKVVHIHSRVQSGLHIGDAVSQGKGDLLGGGGASLPDMVAGN